MALSPRNLMRISPVTWTRCFSSSACRGSVDNNNSNDGLLTIKEVRTHLMNMVGVRSQWGQENAWQNPGVMQPVAESQSELPMRKPSDSLVRARIPLSDANAREKYLLHNGGIRFGRLLEDFDTLAGLICYQHNKNPNLGDEQKSPYAFVTVLVDRIEQSSSQLALSSKKDINARGNVTWVGKSSMECSMYMEQEIDGESHQFLSAKYLFAARNPLTQKAGVINPLEPQTPEEKAAFQLGEENKKKRQLEGSKSLLKAPPSKEERLIIHDMFLSTIDQKSGSLKVNIKPENTIWMEDTILKSLIICHPEQRNLYNKMFGGFLMRQAYELAWSNASIYSKKRPGMCKVVDDILFRKPVEIGSLLFLSSQVVYSSGPDLQVHVHAEVLNPQEDTRETTNDFHFTFDTGLADLPRVMPKTYAEAMMYLMGKRHYES
ncbi:acyl-coenzyme A thioesterase 9, mitochondrial [Elysia marginata]|uniref:Acyl-coenzyme A thioesterase 9, mitochondrial n=1 Tax=Elysia marginata TaxID=1093978 RepID=A0AAV4ILW2_9GAST|nr:acyl-coenzyme A thioesterase 9, mitochondrial [Elysia marginata]